MFKYAFCLLFALAAFQGSQARSVEVDQFQTRGIIDIVEGLVQSIKDIVVGLTTIVGELLAALGQAIADVLNRIPQVINEITQKIEDIIVEAGEVGKKCVNDNENKVDEIIATAQNGFRACVAEAQAKSDAIKAQVDTLVDKVEEIQNTVNQRVTKCVEDAKLNPIKLYNCLRGLVDPIKSDIAEIADEAAHTIEVAKETVKEATLGLAQCVAKVEEDVANKQQALFDAIRECIAGSVN